MVPDTEKQSSESELKAEAISHATETIPEKEISDEAGLEQLAGEIKKTVDAESARVCAEAQKGIEPPASLNIDQKTAQSVLESSGFGTTIRDITESKILALTNETKEGISRITKLQQPKFIKDFSKQSSQEDRDRAAKEIWEKRKENQARKQELSDKEKELKERLEGLKKLEETIADLSENGLSKIKNYFRIRSLRSELAEGENTYNELKDKEIDSPDMDEPRRMLESFYNGEKEKWAKAGYAPEDIKEQFSEEHLKGLSVEDYALLMKRFPGEMVTHVTRQGIRDHASSFWHTAGKGKFSDGFKEMLAGGKLRSSLGIALQEHSKEEAMAKFLHLDNLDDLLPNNTELSRRDKALMMYNNSFESSMATSSPFTDRAAVHVASENVMDEMYGSERGNEIFIAYPSAYVASQLRFGGKGTLADTRADQHNDKWIYTKDHEGMPLGAGLVFLPQDARVDPKNGSRYEIGPDNNPIENESAREGLERLVSSPEFETIVQQIEKQLGSLTRELPSSSTWESELDRSGWDGYGRKDVLKILLPVRDKIREVTGITDDRILSAIFDYSNVTSLKYANIESSERERNIKTNFIIDQILSQSGTRFIEAKNTISSEEYWNQYFAAHPDEKPPKIVFYSGGDPSRALNEWREKNGIVKRTSDPTYGFSEHEIGDSSIEANKGRDRFASFARKVIDDRFPNVLKTFTPTPEELESGISA